MAKELLAIGWTPEVWPTGKTSPEIWSCFLKRTRDFSVSSHHMQLGGTGKGAGWYTLLCLEYCCKWQKSTRGPLPISTHRRGICNATSDSKRLTEAKLQICWFRTFFFSHKRCWGTVLNRRRQRSPPLPGTHYIGVYFHFPDVNMICSKTVWNSPRWFLVASEQYYSRSNEEHILISMLLWDISIETIRRDRTYVKYIFQNLSRYLSN